MHKLKQIILLGVFCILGHCAAVCEAAAPDSRITVLFFFSQSCHVCHELRTAFMPGVIERFKESVIVDYRDLADVENYKLLISLKKERGHAGQISIPTVFVAGTFITGKTAIREGLVGLIEKALRGESSAPVSGAPIDLEKHFESFTPLAVAGAGLIDGVNPCAFTVIVFFISFLALQGYRKRDLAAIGIGFILAVFFTYLLIGMGLFEFFYKIQTVWRLRRMINVSFGIAALGLGILAVYDMFVLRRSGRTEGMTLQLPAAVKARIQRVIGMHYRRTGPVQEDAPDRAARVSVSKLIAAAFVTGFLVSLLEAVCTGQVYLPTIAFVLKTAQRRLDALGYLLMYNLMFIVPLVAIFLLALFGVTSEQFGRALKKHLMLTKALMAALFFVLGAFLIWRG